MRYLEIIPGGPLGLLVRRLWYCADYRPAHPRERMLPNGNASIVFCLSQDRFAYWPAGSESGVPESRPAAVIAGVYSGYSVVETKAMLEMVGIQFRPGCARPFLDAPVDEFTNQDTPLEDVWGRSSRLLRDQLLSAPTPRLKLLALESALRQRLRDEPASRSEVALALHLFHRKVQSPPVAEVTRQTGLSSRRFAEIFRQEVGVTPKLYSRIRRFQKTIRQVQKGEDIRWTELALECGYFDQSHFVNDFRFFSGITPTEYRAGSRVWANHVALSS